jgi:hypothetical protein
MRKLLYLPFGIVASQVTKRVSNKVFEGVWSKFDPTSPPPPAGAGDAWAKTVGGAAIKAATKAGTKAAVDRATARTFYHLFGLWPVKPPKPAAAAAEDAS